ncbi:MAG: DUF72 domain-containing protein [bacterium]|nr:DUF72 domain-containing protein [bacterium]
MGDEFIIEPELSDKIYGGTSGYSYKDWVGPFYPRGTKSGDMLDFYARHFRAVELNFPYYRMPDPFMMRAIAAKAAGRLLFSIKLIREVTHESERDEKLVKEYLEGIEPMQEEGVVGCLLAQFPWKFKYSPEAMVHLEWLRTMFATMALAVEFRNDTWARPEVYAKLAEIGLALVNVDEPDLKGLMPPTAEATGEVGYFRFHGRNKAKWWKHEKAEERYDYLYTKDQLSDWVPRLKEVASKTEKTYVFMNNHPLGQAVTNAAQIMEMLGQEFLDLRDDGGLF